MTKKYYIHVGAPKTATTYLQKKVFNQIKGVRDNDKEGLRPNFENDKLRNFGRQLYFRDTSSHSYKELFDNLYEIEEETIQEKILLSEESFMGYWGAGYINGGSMAFLLKDIFPDAKILLCIREQVDWLISLYRYSSEEEVQKLFKVGTPQEFFYQNNQQVTWKLRRYRPTHTYCWVNWYQHFTKYVRLFGEDNVYLLPYEVFKNRPSQAQQILSNFLDTEIDLDLLISEVINPSKQKKIYESDIEFQKFTTHVRDINQEANGRLNNLLPSINLEEFGYQCR